MVGRITSCSTLISQVELVIQSNVFTKIRLFITKLIEHFDSYQLVVNKRITIIFLPLLSGKKRLNPERACQMCNLYEHSRQACICKLLINSEYFNIPTSFGSRVFFYYFHHIKEHLVFIKPGHDLIVVVPAFKYT